MPLRKGLVGPLLLGSSTLPIFGSAAMVGEVLVEPCFSVDMVMERECADIPYLFGFYQATERLTM